MSGLLCIINANQRIISALLAFVLIYVMFRLVYLLLFIVMLLSGCNAIRLLPHFVELNILQR